MMNKKQRKTHFFDALVSNRILFKEIHEILGIRDLAFLVEAYANRCEGHYVTETIPGSKPIRIPFGATEHYYDDSRGLLFATKKERDYITFVGYTLLGHTVNVFPCGHPFPKGCVIAGVCYSRVLWHTSSALCTIQVTSEESQVERSFPFVYKIWDASQNGLWITYEQSGTCVCFLAWNMEQSFDRNWKFDKVTRLVVFDEDFFYRDGCNKWIKVDNGSDRSLQIPFTPPPVGHVEWLSDGSYLHHNNGDWLHSRGVIVAKEKPEQFKFGLYFPMGQPFSMLLDRHRGFLILRMADQFRIMY
jgi:hypothetical protein